MLFVREMLNMCHVFITEAWWCVSDMSTPAGLWFTFPSISRFCFLPLAV